jgi:hypothetical protein
MQISSRNAAAFKAAAAMSTAFVLTPAHASHTAATSLGTGSGSSINTESAVPLTAGAWSLGTRFEQQVSDRLSDSELTAIVTANPDADVHSVDKVNVVSLDFAYGLTADLTVGLTLPWVERTDVHVPEATGEGVVVNQDGDSSGVGDMKVFGMWRFFEEAATTSNAGLLFGLSVPTGKDDVTDNQGERFEQEFQPGSGSWDPFLGVAYSRGFGRIGLDASVTYTLINEGAQNTDLGDYLSYNLGMAYAFTPDAQLRWNAVLELNGLWRDKQTIGPETDPNSGGNWVEVTPGVTLSGSSWGAFANFGIPIVNDPNGDQDKHGYRFMLGFRYRH